MLLDDLPAELHFKVLDQDETLHALWAAGATVEVGWVCTPSLYQQLCDLDDDAVLVEALAGDCPWIEYNVKPGYLGGEWSVELTVEVLSRHPVG